MNLQNHLKSLLVVCRLDWDMTWHVSMKTSPFDKFKAYLRLQLELLIMIVSLIYCWPFSSAIILPETLNFYWFIIGAILGYFGHKVKVSLLFFCPAWGTTRTFKQTVFIAILFIFYGVMLCCHNIGTYLLQYTDNMCLLQFMNCHVSYILCCTLIYLISFLPPYQSIATLRVLIRWDLLLYLKLIHRFEENFFSNKMCSNSFFSSYSPHEKHLT